MAPKVKMKTGRLDELLKEFGMTRSDVQRLDNRDDREKDIDNGKKLDKKTVIKINQGENVSLGSIEKLSDLFSLPVSELIADSFNETGENKEQDDFIPNDCPFSYHFIFKNTYTEENSHTLSLDGKNLLEMSDRQLLITAEKIRYSLDLSQTLDREIKSDLGDLQSAVDILRGVSNQRAEKVIDDTNLQEIIKIEDAKQVFPNVLKVLRKKGITVWGAHYYDYGREIIEDIPEAQHIYLQYSRESIFVIGITDSKKLENGVIMSVHANLSMPVTQENVADNLDYFFGEFDSFRFEDRWIEKSEYL